jgi:hypothetical protein
MGEATGYVRTWAGQAGARAGLNYGSALAVAIGCFSNIYLGVWMNDLEAVRKEGMDLTRRALQVAGDDPYVLANSAQALGVFGKDIAAAIALIDRSLRLNPSFAVGWMRSGVLRPWAGQFDLAIEHCETSIRSDYHGCDPESRTLADPRGSRILFGWVALGHWRRP